jgi:hypothetical protein
MSSYKITPFEHDGYKLPLAFCIYSENKKHGMQFKPNLVWKQYIWKLQDNLFGKYFLKIHFEGPISGHFERVESHEIQ